jgi:formylmethanofuran dehydrogenase subunit E
MDRAEALRSIRYDLLKYIQKKVSVDFDNARQMPAYFIYRNRRHGVSEVFTRFRTQSMRRLNGYLLRADNGEVYVLYFEFFDKNRTGPFNRIFWVLNFRILSDRELMALYREDRKMLMNSAFQRLADFHGHLCPDLVIGGKLCEYVQKLLSVNEESVRGLSIIAENCTSSLDAIQIMLGATIGNQRLQVIDFGKQNYTINGNNGRIGFRLSMRTQHYGDEDEYHGLEQKILNNQALLDEAVQFQKLVDGRMKRLLNLTPEELFTVEPVVSVQMPTETASIYLSCCLCGEQVLKSRTIECRGETYCIPCFESRESHKETTT